MGSYLQGCVFARVSILFLSLKKKKTKREIFFSPQSLSGKKAVLQKKFLLEHL